MGWASLPVLDSGRAFLPTPQENFEDLFICKSLSFCDWEIYAIAAYRQALTLPDEQVTTRVGDTDWVITNSYKKNSIISTNYHVSKVDALLRLSQKSI